MLRFMQTLATNQVRREWRRGGKEQRSERRVPRAIKNVARHDEQVLPQVPRPDGPVRGHDHREKSNEGE